MENKQNSKKAVFIDRDGTMIVDHGYIKDPNKVDLLPHTIDALELLKSAGFKLFIVTCQSGVGRGMMTMDDVNSVNNKFLQKLGKKYFEDIFICPHSPHENCACRKPATGMIQQAIKKYDLDLKNSFTIGDKDADRDLGFNMGGYGIKLWENGINNLLDAARFLINKSKN